MEAEVFSVNCDDQFKEEDVEVVEDDFIFFSRSQRRSFNRGCRRNLRSSSHSSRSWSPSRRVLGCGTVSCDVSVSDGRGVWFFRQVWRVVQFFGSRGRASFLLVT